MVKDASKSVLENSEFWKSVPNIPISCIYYTEKHAVIRGVLLLVVEIVFLVVNRITSTLGEGLEPLYC